MSTPLTAEEEAIIAAAEMLAQQVAGHRATLDTLRAELDAERAAHAETKAGLDIERAAAKGFANVACLLRADLAATQARLVEAERRANSPDVVRATRILELESTLRELWKAATLFRDYACHCKIINEGRGPKCGHCVMREALARCDAVLKEGK